jgi:ketosteroid isomerase-like protein
LPTKPVQRAKQPPVASPSAADKPAPAPRQPTATPPPAPPVPTVLPQTTDSTPGAPPQTSTLALAVQVEAAAATAPPLEHAARALPQRLEDAYRRGDLAALLLLFAPDIQTEHGGYVPTAGVYRALFATSLQREITLHHIDWQFDQANRATGRGQFEIAVVPRGETAPRQAHGVILFDVVGHPDGRARLAGLRFEGDI